MDKKVEKVTKSTKYREKGKTQNIMLNVGQESVDCAVSAPKSSKYAQAKKKKIYRQPVTKDAFLSAFPRPKVYTDDHPAWQVIIDAISSGLSLSSAVKLEGMPTWSTVQVKIRTDEKYRELYDTAIQSRADYLAEQILELADSDMPDGLFGPGASAWVQQKRLQVDARKWVASKLKPRVYGDRLDVSVSDNRISVLGAIEQAQARVQLGMAKSEDVVDVEPK
jgi:hypothetical protein